MWVTVLTRRCGGDGLEVSRVGLGTWTWGSSTAAEDAELQLRWFLEAGGTLLDTAPAYGLGISEEILGVLLRRTVRRDGMVLSTKAGVYNGVDVSAEAMLASLDGSLRRLGVDHVDLWQVHVWDDATPLEETLGTLDRAVESGRARHVGVCNYRGWQLSRAVTIQQLGGAKARLAAHQTQYSLLCRHPELETVPAGLALRVGLLAWSPLAGGVLTGKYRGGARPPGSRATDSRLRDYIADYLDQEWTEPVVDVVVTVADALGVPPAQVALAWACDRPGVASALVGARTVSQLREALPAEDLVLPHEVAEILTKASE